MGRVGLDDFSFNLDDFSFNLNDFSSKLLGLDGIGEGWQDWPGLIRIR